jgi:hypothetical protein
MGKLNWSCTACGMSAGRKFSVQRHINNPNIHNGIGQVVSYLEYSVGIKEDIYRPQKITPFRRTETPYLDKIESEVQNQTVREIAKRIYNRLPGKEPFLNEFETVVSNYLAKKNLYDILNGINL